MSDIRFQWRYVCAEMRYRARVTWQELNRLWSIRGPYLLVASFFLMVGWSLVPALGDATVQNVIGNGISIYHFSWGAILSGAFAFVSSPYPNRKRFLVGVSIVYIWWVYPAWRFFEAGYYMMGLVCTAAALITLWEGYQWFVEQWR